MFKATEADAPTDIVASPTRPGSTEEKALCLSATFPLNDPKLVIGVGVEAGTLGLGVEGGTLCKGRRGRRSAFRMIGP